ncbi:hypothetical protein KC353_g64 [Hortaea werneckii]|nr:hypothetical protein KC353_g64 [Hortaea werneckii]
MTSLLSTISISLIPIIVRIVFVSIRPAVCQIHFPRFRTNVGKSVQHVVHIKAVPLRREELTTYHGSRWTERNLIWTGGRERRQKCEDNERCRAMKIQITSLRSKEPEPLCNLCVGCSRPCPPVDFLEGQRWKPSAVTLHRLLHSDCEAVCARICCPHPRLVSA